MKLRAVMAVVLLALAFQGPVGAFTSTLGAGKPTGSTPCSVHGLSLADCCDCCSNGAGPSCSAACGLSVGMGLLSDATLQIPAAHRAAILDPGAALFIGHDPPRPLRPPIV